MHLPFPSELIKPVSIPRTWILKDNKGFKWLIIIIIIITVNPTILEFRLMLASVYELTQLRAECKFRGGRQAYGGLPTDHYIHPQIPNNPVGTISMLRCSRWGFYIERRHRILSWFHSLPLIIPKIKSNHILQGWLEAFFFWVKVLIIPRFPVFHHDLWFKIWFEFT